MHRHCSYILRTLADFFLSKYGCCLFCLSFFYEKSTSKKLWNSSILKTVQAHKTPYLHKNIFAYICLAIKARINLTLCNQKELLAFFPAVSQVFFQNNFIFFFDKSVIIGKSPQRIETSNHSLYFKYQFENYKLNKKVFKYWFIFHKNIFTFSLNFFRLDSKKGLKLNLGLDEIFDELQRSYKYLCWYTVKNFATYKIC